MSKFMNFSANVQSAFDNNESDYMNFSQMLRDYRVGTFQAGVTKADADELLREKFRLVMGIDENASPKEVKRAIKRSKNEIFEIIEDTVDDMLTSGWTDNEFFREFVEIKNLALQDANEFISEDQTVLSVGKVSGNHWDIDRQRLGVGEAFRVPTYWVGLGVYEEFERVMTGRADWTKLTNKIYEAVDAYVDEIVYKAVTEAGQKVLPGSEQFYKTAVLDANSKPIFMQMVEDVQAANRGSEVVIMGSKSALAKLSALTDIHWISQQDKLDRRNMGRVGMWEGTRLVEIPQVFAKGTTEERLVNPNMLMIMPVADNKFIKLVYEGNSEIKEVTDNTVNQDMTYEIKYLTKLGCATIIGRYFAVWNATQG